MIKIQNPQLADLHIHTLYSDGKQTPEKMIQVAVKKGLKVIGITDHSPLPFPSYWAMKRNRFDSYVKELQRLKEKYKKQIEILVGIEADYLKENIYYFRSLPLNNLDYIIGSVHFFGFTKRDHIPYSVDESDEDFQEALATIFQNDIRKLCKNYYTLVQEMVKLGSFDIVGHLDLVKKFNRDGKYFSEKEKWYQNLVDQTIKIIQKSKMTLEVNTAGLDKPVAEIYPSPDILEKIKKLEIPIMFSSDAHSSGEIARCFKSTFQLLQKL